MLDAIDQFSRSGVTKHLRQVRIVIYDQPMMTSFREYFLKKAATRQDPPGTDERAQQHDLG